MSRRMLALGFQSKREITRIRIRIRTAMATQTREQGRYLGGRPPYGYRLADAGPHPNKAHAAWAGARTGWNPTRTPHRPRGQRAARPSRARDPAVSAGRAAALRHMRAAAGVRLVQRQARLPVPSRLYERHSPDPARPKNLHVREDQVLPCLAALAILHAGKGRRPGKERATSEITAPAQAADLIDQLRAGGVSLIYDPATKSLSTDASDAVAVSAG